jgi:2'-5' RNA ligase
MTSPVRAARLFAAVAFTGAEKRALAAAARPLRELCAGGRFPPEQLLHITLHFFGQTPLDRLPAIESAMERAARGISPFDLTTGRAGTFGRGNAAVLWLGVDGGADRLRALRAALEAALREEGFPPENREFRAHITLGRDVRLGGSPAGVELPGVTLRVGGVTLMESTTASGRLDYVPLVFTPFQS